MSYRGTHNEQLNKPAMFDSLWLELVAPFVVVTKAAKEVLTPSKQSPRLRHNCNMLS
jgi:hypothetical protein